jgi:hypothetical protein
MKKSMVGLAVLALAAMALAQEAPPPQAPPAQGAQPEASAQPTGPERVEGVLNNHGGPLSNFFQAGWFKITVDRYSTDDEAKALLSALKNGGQKLLLEKLWDMKVIGRISVGGSMGFPLVFARSRTTPDGGRVIRFLTNRGIAPAEFYNATRSTQYPFGFIEIFLPAGEKGYGSLIPMAQVEMSPSGQLSVESFGIMPFRLLDVDVKPGKKK